MQSNVTNESFSETKINKNPRTESFYKSLEGSTTDNIEKNDFNLQIEKKEKLNELYNNSKNGALNESNSCDDIPSLIGTFSRLDVNQNPIISANDNTNEFKNKGKKRKNKYFLNSKFNQEKNHYKVVLKNKKCIKESVIKESYNQN